MIVINHGIPQKSNVPPTIQLKESFFTVMHDALKSHEAFFSHVGTKNDKMEFFRYYIKESNITMKQRQ